MLTGKTNKRTQFEQFLLKRHLQEKQFHVQREEETDYSIFARRLQRLIAIKKSQVPELR